MSTEKRGRERERERERERDLIRKQCLCEIGVLYAPHPESVNEQQEHQGYLGKGRERGGSVSSYSDSSDNEQPRKYFKLCFLFFRKNLFFVKIKRYFNAINCYLNC